MIMNEFTLNFKSNASLRNLAKETLKAKEFLIPYSEETTDKPNFELVKDWGIYVMNSYDRGDKENLVCYAKGFNPKTNDDYHQDCKNAVGGDDFVESIPLTMEQLVRLEKGGNLTIVLTETTLEVKA
tara:strand:+ start:232 stop:612 length:381 start_codon:yes stop_codon:yes gene_type:complete